MGISAQEIDQITRRVQFPFGVPLGSRRRLSFSVYSQVWTSILDQISLAGG